MQKRTKLKQQLLITGCVGALIASTGCRSASPKWNLFSWRNQPSAEMLAGNGPTITYPTPPGELASPEAIASVAGGTTGTSAAPENVASRIAGLPSTAVAATISDNNAVNRGVTNRGAAQANGFNMAAGNAAPQTLGSNVNPNSSIPAIPAGYQFGAKTAASTAQDTSASHYEMPSSYAVPGVQAATSASAAITKQPAAGMGLPASNAVAGPPRSMGFAMPGTISPSTISPPPQSSLSLPSTASNATNAMPFTPKTASTAGPKNSGLTAMGMGFPSDAMPSSSAPTSSAPTSSAMPPATAPSFSTASAALSPRSDSAVLNTGAMAPSSSYAPGSTSGAAAYPSTSGYPSTGASGSFYR